jgi:transcriptional regulator with XRE-family HTH domain
MVKMAHTETLGGRITRLRRDKEIPQYQLASQIGLHPSSLNQIEKGKRNPKTETVSALASALGVSRDYLLDGNPAGPPSRADPREARHAEPATTLEVSAVIHQAVQTAIRAAITDILNAVSESLAADRRSENTEGEDSRPKAKTVPTRRH